MAHVADIRRDGSSFFSAFGELRDNLVARYSEYRVYRNTYDELSRLSARELADLGLAHADLREVARGQAAAI